LEFSSIQKIPFGSQTLHPETELGVQVCATTQLPAEQIFPLGHLELRSTHNFPAELQMAQPEIDPGGQASAKQTSDALAKKNNPAASAANIITGWKYIFFICQNNRRIFSKLIYISYCNYNKKTTTMLWADQS
jgi:hypothetical protein